MPPYDSEPLGHSLDLHELHYRLTLVQRWATSRNANQVQVAAPKGGCNFGEMNGNDWDLEDPRQHGKIVAHAKGLHIRASISDWHRCHTSFDIIFEDGSGLEGSTLQVMGPNTSEGEWSIVGGTGKLTMARGVIYKEYLGEVDGGSKSELEIHAFYIPMDRPNNRYGSGIGKNVWRW